MKKTILTLTANPDDTTALKLNREIRAIQEQFQMAPNRDDFQLVRRDATSWDDLQRAIFEFKPRIVHFCGHGARQQGLVFEQEQGRSFVITAEVLSNLFKQVADDVECVLLNACYSTEQAQAISQHINYVIGMNRPIQDDVAIAYAKGFYLALGAGQTIAGAHENGLNNIQAQVTGGEVKRDVGLPIGGSCSHENGFDHLIPELLIKNPLTPFPNEQEETSLHHANQSLTALRNLLDVPEIHEAVVTYRSDFKSVCEQIHQLTYYKSLHDLLHQVEIECYRNILQDSRRFPDDELSVITLTEYEIRLQGMLHRAQTIISHGNSSNPSPHWIQELEKIHTEFRVSISDLDDRRLANTICLMTHFLAYQPVRFNNSLTEAAKTLRLPDVVHRLQQLWKKIEKFEVDPGIASQFEKELKSMETLNNRLTQLVHIHDDWQRVDATLRYIEKNLQHDIQELTYTWSFLKEDVAALCIDDSDPDFVCLRNNEKHIDKFLETADSSKVKAHFSFYRQAALNCFSLVDYNLRKLCGELQNTGQSLALIVEKLS